MEKKAEDKEITYLRELMMQEAYIKTIFQNGVAILAQQRGMSEAEIIQKIQNYIDASATGIKVEKEQHENNLNNNPPSLKRYGGQSKL